jgi:hypothetical protein
MTQTRVQGLNRILLQDVVSATHLHQHRNRVTSTGGLLCHQGLEEIGEGGKVKSGGMLISSCVGDKGGSQGPFLQNKQRGTRMVNTSQSTRNSIDHIAVPVGS